jgi:large conductance mechanosensitive channel
VHKLIQGYLESTMGFMQEFKQFAFKGNAIDMAVGIILGVAFNKVVTSIVNDLIMPPVGMALGGTDFRNLRVVLKEGAISATGEPVAEVAIRYGAFINTLIEFLLVALSVFVIVKLMSRIVAKREPPAPATH